MNHKPMSPERAARNSWVNMKRRCDDKKFHAYHRYGGRGITYCDRWKSYENFLQDMGYPPLNEKFNSYLTLDRNDNNIGYNKDNCRWATRKQQQENTSHRECKTS